MDRLPFRPDRAGFRTRGRRLLLLEALAMLLLARVLVFLVPLRWVTPWLGRRMHETPQDDPGPRAIGVRDCLRAVADGLPWEPRCLERAVAGHLMLRRRGLSCTLYLGVNLEEGSLQAHAWLRCGSLAMSGQSEAAAYRTICCFGWAPGGGRGGLRPNRGA